MKEIFKRLTPLSFINTIFSFLGAQLCPYRFWFYECCLGSTKKKKDNKDTFAAGGEVLYLLNFKTDWAKRFLVEQRPVLSSKV